MSELTDILNFIKEVEALKNVTRTAWTSEGRQESVAEHSWRLAVFALALAGDFPELDFARVLGMCVVHDFGEIYEGDVSAKFESDPEGKLKREERAVKQLIGRLPESQKQKILDLWQEYNSAETGEARLVKALDKLETIVQHNQGKNPPDFDYEFNLGYGSRYTEYDNTVKNLRKMIDRDTAGKAEFIRGREKI